MGNFGGRIISAVWEKQSANSDVGEMEQKTRGDWLYVHEDNTEGGVVVCAGRK